MTQARILFVCTGNYFRSRFAEIYFNHAAGSGRFAAFSRGFAPNIGNVGPISRYAADELAELGIPVPARHRMPVMLSEDDILAAHTIIALNRSEHLRFVNAMFPQHLGKFTFWNVKDVHEELPGTALAGLRASIDGLIAELEAAPAPTHIG